MHWRNSEFQIDHFLLGRAHTPDEAYRVLRELGEERADALTSGRVALRRLAARERRARIWWRRITRAGRLEVQAELQEIHHEAEKLRVLIAAAERELAHIQRRILEVEPQRQFRHLPDHVADQACQREQWRLELQERARQHLVATGTIPAAELEAMRLHPDWVTHVLPVIRETQAAIEARRADDVLLGRPAPAYLS